MQRGSLQDKKPPVPARTLAAEDLTGPWPGVEGQAGGWYGMPEQAALVWSWREGWWIEQAQYAVADRSGALE